MLACVYFCYTGYERIGKDLGLFGGDEKYIAMKCSSCSKGITGKYYIASEKNYCPDCYDDFRIKCAICKINIEGEYFIYGKRPICHGCDDKPQCNSCNEPYAELEKYKGGEYCTKCKRESIFDRKKGDAVYEKARRDHLKYFGYFDLPYIRYEIVKISKLKKLSGSDSTRGFYRYKYIKRTNDVDITDETIYLKMGLPEKKFYKVTLHELSHQLLTREFYGIKEKPEWMEEGLCEYMAALILRQQNELDAVKSIATNKHKVYGDGYRWYVRKFGKDNWPGVKKWLKEKGYKKVKGGP